jgi:hypothetical protein
MRKYTKTNWDVAIEKLMKDFRIDKSKIDKVINNVKDSKTELDTNETLYNRAHKQFMEIVMA